MKRRAAEEMKVSFTSEEMLENEEKQKKNIRTARSVLRSVSPEVSTLPY